MAKIQNFIQGVWQNPTNFLMDGQNKVITPNFGTQVVSGTPFTASTFNDLSKNLFYTLLDISADANTIECTFDNFVQSNFNQDLKIVILPKFTNTGASSLGINTLPVMPIKKNNNIDLEAGDIVANQPILLTYNALGYLQLVTKDYEAKISKVALGGIPYGGTTTNAGNVYSISTPAIATLIEGMAVSFKCNADSTGAVSLNWDGKGAKSVLKSNSSAVTNWKANGIYTVRCGGTSFTLQGEGATGNATASDLLSGKMASTDAGEIIGTLALSGNAVASNVLVSATFYSNDPKTKLTGAIPTIPTDGFSHYITTTASVGVGGDSPINRAFLSIPYNSYTGVNGWVGIDAPDLSGNNILVGKNILGVEGNIPNRTNLNVDALSVRNSGTYVVLKPPAGFYDGTVSEVRVSDTDYIANNIRLNTNLFGLVGTMPDGTGMKKTASGIIPALGDGSSPYAVTGLSFIPKVITINAAEYRQTYVYNGDANTNNIIYKYAYALISLLTVTSSGFSGFMPPVSSSVTINWIAYEY